MLTDIQIAQLAKVKHIDVIAKKAGINKKYLEPYGNNKAKVNLDIMKELEERMQKTTDKFQTESLKTQQEDLR